MTGQVSALPLRATGIMDWGIREVNQRLVVLPLADAQALLNTGGVSKFHVKLKDRAAMERVKADLEAHLRTAGLDVRVFRWSDRALFYHQVRGLLLGFLLFTVSIAVLVSLASLANVAYMNVMDRIREYGVLRSFGFSRSFTVLLCAMENAQLGVAAAAAGVAGSALVIASVNAAQLSWVPPGSSNAVPIALNWSLSVCGIAAFAAVAVSSIAAVPPARHIVKKQIHATLSDL
jgi:putative ABC transport system permease protein